MCTGIGGRPEIGRVRSSLLLLELVVGTGTGTVVAAGCPRVVAVGTVGFPPPIVGGAGGCGWRKLGVATAVPLSVPECPRSGQQYTNRSCRSSLNCLYESVCNNVHVRTKLCLSLYVGVWLCVCLHR